MNPENSFDILTNFYSPLGVGVIVFIISAVNQFWTKRQDKKRLKITVLDEIIIALKSADQTLENLKSDATNNYFNFNNQKKGKRVAERLEKAVESASVFPNEDLRKEILQNIEDFNTLVQDVEGLENFAFNQSDKFSQTKDKSLNELKKLKLHALTVDICIVETNEIISLKKGKNDKRVEVIKNIYDMLDQNYVEAKNNLDASNDFCKQRRIHFTILIVDNQTKLRELCSRLQNLRDTIASNWLHS